MLIQLTLDPARLWRWHGVLVQALAAIPGQRVRVRAGDGPKGQLAAEITVLES